MKDDYMPHPNTLITSYPPSELDSIINDKKPKKLNIFVDFKNISVGLFVPQIIEEIVINSSEGKLDSSIFQSALFFSSWWKKYANSKNIDCEVFISSDVGVSMYHKKIHKGYKASRDVAKSTETMMELSKIRQKNSELCEKIFNKIPKCHFIFTKFLESDFIPYYIITRKNRNNQDELNIICSTDKDMYQILTNDNTIQIFKNKGTKYLVNKDNALLMYTKIAKKDNSTDTKNVETVYKCNNKYISAIMSLVGDSSDDVPGINGLGPIKATQIFANEEFVNQYIGTMEELDNRISSGGCFFKEDISKYNFQSKSLNKIFYDEKVNEITTNAYKLISFEQLCRWLEKSDTTEKLDWIKYINNSIDEKGQLLNHELLYKTMNTNFSPCYLTEEDSYHLFT